VPQIRDLINPKDFSEKLGSYAQNHYSIFAPRSSASNVKLTLAFAAISSRLLVLLRVAPI